MKTAVLLIRYYHLNVIALLLIVVGSQELPDLSEGHEDGLDTVAVPPAPAHLTLALTSSIQNVRTLFHINFDGNRLKVLNFLAKFADITGYNDNSAWYLLYHVVYQCWQFGRIVLENGSIGLIELRLSSS